MNICLNCFVLSLIAHEFVHEQIFLLVSLFMNKFFCLGLACLLNELKTKAQDWLIYK